MRYFVLFSILPFTISCANSPNTKQDILDGEKKMDSINKANYQAQFTEDETTLKRYTYFVAGVLEDLKTNGQTGSGFFVRRNSRILFISNYHVLSGISPYTRKSVKQDLYGIGISLPDLVTFPAIKDAAVDEAIQNLNAPDLIISDVATTSIIPLDSIRDISGLIDPLYFEKTPEEIYVFGYPTERMKSFLTPDGEIVKGEYLSPEIANRFDKNAFNKNLPQEQFIFQFKKFHFFGKISTKPGMSGSPVFGKFTIDGKTSYRFIGVCVGDNGNDIAFMIKGGQVFKGINNYISKNP